MTRATRLRLTATPPLGQFGVNPRSTIRPSTPAVNRLDASPELGIGPCPSRRRTTTPRVVPARGDTEHPGHRGDTETSLIRAHDPVGLPGRASRANQAVAFANISRSSHRRRFSRRSRRSSSRSSVRSPSLRSPASRPPARPRFGSPGTTARTREPGPPAHVRTEPGRPSVAGTPPRTVVSSSASRILLLPQELSTRRSRTHVCMKQGYRMADAGTEVGFYQWCREPVQELDPESREHPVLRHRSVRRARLLDFVLRTPRQRPAIRR